MAVLPYRRRLPMRPRPRPLAQVPLWRPRPDGEIARLQLGGVTCCWPDFWLGCLVVEPQMRGRR